MDTANDNRRNVMQMTLAMLAAVCAIVLAHPAQAENKADTAERLVRVSDLNLNDSDGVEVLYQRIRVAANAVCGWAGPVAPDWWRPSRACIDQAIGQAVTTIANPTLTNRYLASRSHTEKRSLMAQTH